MDQNRNLPAWRRSPDLFWPILLIGAGVILLLSNLGLIASNPLPLLWRFWPVILIAIGVDILFGRRGIWGSLVSALLALLVIAGVVVFLLVAQNNPALLRNNALFATPDLHTEHITQPLGQVHRADVTLNLGSGVNSVSASGNSSSLLEGDVTYYGSLVNTLSTSGDRAQVVLGTQSAGLEPLLFQGGQQRFNVTFNPTVEYNFTLNTGSGSNQFDLGPFTLDSLALDSGSGQVGVSLPSRGQYRFRVNVGSGDVIIRAPEGTAVRVEYNVGSGSVDAPKLTRSGDSRGGTFESANFSQSGAYVIIQLDLGSGHVTIQ